MTDDDDDDDIGQSHLFSNINNDSYELYCLKPTGVFFLNRNFGMGTGTEMGERGSGYWDRNGRKGKWALGQKWEEEEVGLYWITVSGWVSFNSLRH